MKIVSEFPYEESYGPAYNYEVGYLDGLRAALLIVLNEIHEPLSDAIRKRIEEQKESVKEEIPDE
jgi:hypothetical protein